MNRNQSKTTKGAFLPEIQNLAWKFFASCVMVVSLFSMLFKCVIVARRCAIVARDLPRWHTKNVFTFHSHSRVRVKQCAWNLHQSYLTFKSIDLKKKKQPKTIIRTGVTGPNVQKCVMVATFTLYVPSLKENTQY